MEGYTDRAFRTMARLNGADVVYTEFISSDAIAHHAKTAFGKMDYDPREQPVVCQIFGKNQESFAVAAREIERRGFAGVDINLGCPAKKVVRNGTGVALMRSPAFVRELVQRTLDAVSIPVSLKMRASIRRERRELAPDSKERYTALELIQGLDGLPVSAVMIHGRSYEDGFSGPIDTDMIRSVKQYFSGPVLANGGVTSPERANELLESTGADGVGIARGSFGQPWIFSQCKDFLAHGTYGTPQGNELRVRILEHAHLAEQAKGDWGIIELRKHLAAYISGIPNASTIRSQLMHVDTVAAIEQILNHIPL